MVETVKCGNGHECPAGSKFCNTCGVEIIEPDFKCQGCGATNDKGSRFCSSCGKSLIENISEDITSQGNTANHTAGINIQDDHEVNMDENMSTEGGVKLGDTGMIKDSTISSTTNIHQHSGVRKHVTQATKTGEKCPECGVIAKEDYFTCKGCNKDFLCIEHQDKATYLCQTCATEQEQKATKYCPICGKSVKKGREYFMCQRCKKEPLCIEHLVSTDKVCEECADELRNQEKHEINYSDGSKYFGNILVDQKQQNQLKSVYGKITGDTPASKRHGKGTLTLPDGTRYVGFWKKNRKHGQGTYKFHDGRTQEGEYDNDERVGQWVYTWLDGAKAVGEFKDDVEYGQWVCTWPNGKKYIGNFKNGRKHGSGTLTMPNDSKYDGDWQDDRINGKGTYTRPDGRKYVGNWKNGKMHGREGRLTFPNGERYVGEFKDGKEVGGKYFHTDGDVTWSYVDSDGQWVNQEFTEKS